MPSHLPGRPADRPLRRPSHGLPRRKGGVVHHEVRIDARLNGFWGAVAAIVFLLLLAVIFVLGLLTITVVLWIACGAMLLGLMTALFRSFKSPSGRRPPPESRP